MSNYKLRVSHLPASNPWTHDYVPPVPKSDDNAHLWASKMQRTLGREYACTLLRDGVPVDIDGNRKIATDLFGEAA